ncbi:MAG TPA: alpha/beta fold hydrolase [Allosphingosinicella sp.]|jgi:dipeptidyl aminopeptidase/acylaminoacyl peptidase
MLIGAALALAAVPPALAAETAPAPAPAPVPIEALGEMPFISDPVLSPDGRRVLARMNSQGTEALAVYDLQAPRDAPPKIVPHPGSARWFSWAGNDRVLVGNTLFTLVMGILPLPMTRATSYDLATGKTTVLVAGAGMLADDLLYTDPAGRFVLLAAQKTFLDSPSVMRVDLATGTAVEVQRKQADIWNWFADDSGSLRGGISYGTNGWSIYRRDAGGNLHKAGSGKFLPNQDIAVDSIRLLPGEDSGVIVTNERTGRFGVYRYDLNTQAIGEPIFEHPEVDVTKPQIAEDGKAVEAVYYEDDLPRVVWMTPELKRLQAQIDGTFPGKVNRILGLSRDRNVALIWTGAADDPGGYYVFDRKAKRMNAFAAPYEALIDQRLSPVKPVRYEARDGLAIRGYLTLPAGRPAKALPLILMPHGGPFLRDSYEFDPLVQLLASRGYAVLQPNFRGSTGFGRDFVERGYGEWGRKMQDDLDDGVAWLAAQGTIDPKRVCIVGGSYGGYAALWGAIRNPEIYRCAISFAGVTDLRAMLKFDARFMVASRYWKLWRKKVEGEEKRDLAAVSPLQQAARLNVPVLIAHGEQDGTVPFEQGRQLVAALKARSANVQSAFYPRAAHGFSRSEDRIDYMKRVEAFLEVHNPADGVRHAGPRDAQLVAGAVTSAALLAGDHKKPKRNAVDLRYLVTDDGRVTSCQVTGPSGAADIDKRACELAEQQLQYRPASGADGAARESWLTYSIAWDAERKKK